MKEKMPYKHSYEIKKAVRKSVGRKDLRSVLYQMALTMVETNDEMKRLYHYLKTREKDPLRKMQALIVISKKILVLVHTLAKKKENYDPDKEESSISPTRQQSSTSLPCAFIHKAE